MPKIIVLLVISTLSIGFAETQPDTTVNSSVSLVEKLQNDLREQSQLIAKNGVEINLLTEKMEAQSRKLASLQNSAVENDEIRIAGHQVHGAIWTSFIGGGLIGIASVIQYRDPYRINNTAVTLNIVGLGFYCISIYKAYNSGTHLISSAH